MSEPTNAPQPPTVGDALKRIRELEQRIDELENGTLLDLLQCQAELRSRGIR